MCRYGMTTYKPHYACFACRKAFRRRLRKDQPQLSTGPDKPARCPQCGLLMADLGLDFKPPKTSDDKAWDIVAKLWEVGITFHSCGCGGPGYRPRDPRAYRQFLQQTLAGYHEMLRRWQEGSPQNTREANNQREAIANWRARIARIDRIQATLKD
jgi:DNA-directed RNA polymerase subunit RPC12/RpoP